METAHIVGGNHVTSPALPGAEQVEARFYVSGVDVLAPDDTAIAVAFGDFWFEAVGSTTGAHNRSVDFLNRRRERGWVVTLDSRPDPRTGELLATLSRRSPASPAHVRAVPAGSVGQTGRGRNRSRWQPRWHHATRVPAPDRRSYRAGAAAGHSAGDRGKEQ